MSKWKLPKSFEHEYTNRYKCIVFKTKQQQQKQKQKNKNKKPQQQWKHVNCYSYIWTIQIFQ
jgi:hypothetical protein